jgi:hypothetical protein
MKKREDRGTGGRENFITEFNVPTIFSAHLVQKFHTS